MERRAFIIRILGGLILALLTGWLFEEISDILKQTATVDFDRGILIYMEQHRSPGLTAIMELFTLLGTIPVYAAWTVIYFLYLLRRRRRIQAGMLVINALGALAIIGLLKAVYKRPRPDIMPLTHVPGYSFPSGHAVGVSAIYGFIAYLLSRRMPWYGKVITWAIYIILVAGITSSRVYLGVHWPTDVIAGVLAGLAWLAVCISALHVLEHREWFGGFRR